MSPIATPTTAPLSPHDAALLRRHGAALKQNAWVLAFCAVLMFGAAVALAAIALGTPGDMRSILLGFAALVGVAGMLIIGLGIRRHRQEQAPMRAVVAIAHKTIVRGTLTGVGIDGPRARYTVDGQPIAVIPILGLDTRSSHLGGRALAGLRHLANCAVELHWATLGGANLLLQVHYPDARAPVRATRPITSADRRRAGRPERRFIAFVALLLFACVIGGAWMSGFDLPLSLFIAAYMATILALVFAFSALPQIVRARGCTHLHTVSGPVTEIVTARIPWGKGSTEATWYRIDGQLFCPFGVGDEAQLGNRVTLEFIGGADSGDGGQVIDVRRDGPASRREPVESR